MVLSYPICSMYGIFAYVWLKFMVKVGNIPYMEPMGMFCRFGLFSIASSGSLNRWDRWYIITQLAVYTTYIPLIVLASWMIICYLRIPPIKGTRCFTPLIFWLPQKIQRLGCMDHPNVGSQDLNPGAIPTSDLGEWCTFNRWRAGYPNPWRIHGLLGVFTYRNGLIFMVNYYRSKYTSPMGMRHGKMRP